ncbi:MAG: Na+:H+ antiporter, NhaC family, partial [Candidatus Hydrogenedentes bacterium]|nr:Na+:H+ antiporter, NhaC family [Candidatus Hydrogenedentota bacterium]
IVGALIGLWIVSGIVPSMICYGIQILHPSVFLLVACVVCSVVSMAVGSSWSTMGTVGVALMGIGKALGFPDAMVAGAIISGAYLGDKMSPLSDTTNLAPAVAGSELFTHVKHMCYTTVPAYTLTLLGFTGIGLFYRPGDFDAVMVKDMVGAIEGQFNIQWYLMLVPVAVIAMVAKRVPAIPALVAGALLGALAAVLFQPQQFDGGWQGAYTKLLATAFGGFTLDSGQEAVDALLSRGGMLSMVNTVILIVMAMLYGGVMEATGMLPRIAQAILHLVRGASSLIVATVTSCIVFNFTASEQYLSIVLTGRMFRPAYERYRLAPRNLSRALEDGGTVTSVLVPWNTCGAFASSVLAVPTLAYAPFCLFNLLSPVVAIMMACLGLAIVRLDENGQPAL